MDQQQAHAAWRGAERIKRLSDRLVSIGRFGLGIDGLIAWVPGANLAYGVTAAVLLLLMAKRAGARPGTWARMVAYLTFDNLTDTVPIIGFAVDTIFPGHLMAANALQKDIEQRYGAPDDIEAVPSPAR